LPANAVELVDLRCASIEHRLGYFRDAPFVIFGYCPGGGEVIWRDGESSGFGTGGWRLLLYEIAPRAARQGVNLGDTTTAGTHVLLMDRVRGAVYGVTREEAEAFLARVSGVPVRRRRCLCALMNCDDCPLRATCKAHRNGGSSSGGPSPAGDT
jgi:hypothetical protein